MKNNLENLEIKNMLGKLVTMIDMLIPKKVSVSYIAENTCKSRQSVRQYLINNFNPEQDFWKEGGKLYVNRDTALIMLQRSNNKQLLNVA
jgi:hypothetical protein